MIKEVGCSLGAKSPGGGEMVVQSPPSLDAFASSDPSHRTHGKAFFASVFAPWVERVDFKGDEGVSQVSEIGNSIIEVAYGFDGIAWDDDVLSYAEPCLMLPPLPTPSDWVIRKVLELSKKMGVSFTSIEYQVEELFKEIERRYQVFSKRSDWVSPGETRNRKVRELNGLLSSVNYDGSNSGGRRSRVLHRDSNRSRSLSLTCDGHETLDNSLEC